MRVLVTGGAKRLGAAIVRAVAAAGHVPVIHYSRSVEAARALAEETGGAAIDADLADPAAAATLIARAAAAAGGPIEGLVNSASTFEEDRFDAIDPVLAARLHQINCVSPAMLSVALSAQPRLGEGAVVNLLDQKVANPNPDYFSYSLTKFALEGATAMLAKALAPRVRVNAVSPGLTLPSGDQDAAAFDAVARANLLRRPVGAEAVAEAVVWLLEARSVTGQNVFVDAGQRFIARDRDVMFGGDA